MEIKPQDKKKKKNRLGGGTAKPVKKAEKKEGEPTAWKELSPDMTKVEAQAKALQTLQAKKVTKEIPEGVCFIKDFISKEEEAALLEFFDGQEWDNTPSMRRRTQQWGYKFDYEEMTVVDEATALPAILKPVLDRMLSIPEEDPDPVNRFGTGRYPYPAMPDQLIVNEYTPGQGIHSHVDRNCFGPCIASLSLGGGCSFVFDKPGPETLTYSDLGNVPSFAKTPTAFTSSALSQTLYFPPRALVMLSGTSRTQWTHEIPMNTWDDPLGDGHRITRARRVSLTFRTMTSKALQRLGQPSIDLSKAWGGAVPPKEEKAKDAVKGHPEKSEG